MKLYFKILHKIKSLLGSEVSVPSYEVKRNTIVEYGRHYHLNILVETGTFFGDTIEFCKPFFHKLYSIELAEDLALKAQKRFESDPSVSILQGDSGILLRELVSNLEEPALFWLDGHYSSEFFVGDVFIRTAKSDLNTPIIKELEAILSVNRPWVILIDDAREFNGVGDYPSIGQIRKLVQRYGGKFDLRVDNDIIRITPAKP